MDEASTAATFRDWDETEAQMAEQQQETAVSWNKAVIRQQSKKSEVAFAVIGIIPRIIQLNKQSGEIHTSTQVR